MMDQSLAATAERRRQPTAESQPLTESQIQALKSSHSRLRTALRAFLFYEGLFEAPIESLALRREALNECHNDLVRLSQATLEEADWIGDQP
jgi:hypothetical protein